VVQGWYGPGTYLTDWIEALHEMIVRLRGLILGKRRSQVFRLDGLRAAAAEGPEHPALSGGQCQGEVGHIGASVLSPKFFAFDRRRNAGPSTPFGAQHAPNSAQDENYIINDYK
jgi:hypothetical protein